MLQPKDPEPHLSAGPLLENQNRFSDAEAGVQAGLRPRPLVHDALDRHGQYLHARPSLHRSRGNSAQAGRTPSRGRWRSHAAGPDAGCRRPERARDRGVAAGSEAGPRRRLACSSTWQTYTSMRRNTIWPSLSIVPCWRPSPTIPSCATAWAGCSCSNANFPEAQQELLAALKLKPIMGTAYGDLAVAANENKNYELVIKALDARGQASAGNSRLAIFCGPRPTTTCAHVQAGSGELSSLPRDCQRGSIPIRNGRPAIA